MARAGAAGLVAAGTKDQRRDDQAGGLGRAMVASPCVATACIQFAYRLFHSAPSVWSLQGPGCPLHGPLQGLDAFGGEIV